MPLSATWSDILTTIGTDGFIASTVAQSAKMNQGVLQNLLWLKGRPYSLVADFDGNAFETTSSTFQDSGKAATLTTTGGRVLVVAFGSVLINSTTSALLTIYEDGVNQGDAVFGMGQFAGNGSRIGFAFAHLTNTAPSAAAHTWKLYARSFDNVNAVRLLTAEVWALEIGA